MRKEGMMEEKMSKEIMDREKEAEEFIRYEDSGIDSRILRAVSEMGFVEMTPIQAQAIPVLLTGADVIGQAQTGTGKTAAFGIPMLQKLLENDCIEEYVFLVLLSEILKKRHKNDRGYLMF